MSVLICSHWLSFFSSICFNCFEYQRVQGAKSEIPKGGGHCGRFWFKTMPNYKNSRIQVLGSKCTLKFNGHGLVNVGLKILVQNWFRSSSFFMKCA